jgi:quercetin dioxygenase-like cupin family protein
MKHIVLAMAASAALAGPAAANGPEQAAHGAGEVVTLNFSHSIPNIPGKSLVAVEVVYPPGGKSPAHRHAKSAFIYGYVVSGSIRSQIEGQPPHVYKAGESFFEDPGAHHLAGENTSATEPAKLLAVFVVDSDDTKLTIPDK